MSKRKNKSAKKANKKAKKNQEVAIEEIPSVASELIAEAGDALKDFEDEGDGHTVSEPLDDENNSLDVAALVEENEGSQVDPDSHIDAVDARAEISEDFDPEIIAGSDELGEFLSNDEVSEIVELGELDGLEMIEDDGEEISDEDAFGDLDAILAEENEESEKLEAAVDTSATDGTELDAFESAIIEEEEQLEDDEVSSIIESILFATDKPQSFSLIKEAFKGTNIKSKQIKRAIDLLATEYAGARRGVTLEEVTGGYQLRTKMDNMPYLKRMLKVRTFKVSGPALEVLSIVAYKQPCIKSDVDEIRGVESGHLMRGLMDRGMLAFAGKSDLPGKPMFYQTTRKFLEIFGLRSLKELPSLTEIDELIPDGIEEQEEKKTLDMLTDDLSEEVGKSYSEGEEELEKITGKLSEITTTTDFFEQEKQRQKDKRDAERAQDIREALEVGEDVEAKDVKWLERYEAKLKEKEEEAARKAEEEAMSVAAEEGEVSADTEQAMSEDGDLIAQEEVSDSIKVEASEQNEEQEASFVEVETVIEAEGTENFESQEDVLEVLASPEITEEMIEDEGEGTPEDYSLVGLEGEDSERTQDSDAVVDDSVVEEVVDSMELSDLEFEGDVEIAEPAPIDDAVMAAAQIDSEELAKEEISEEEDFSLVGVEDNKSDGADIKN